MQTVVTESQYEVFAAITKADATYEEFCAAIEEAVKSNNGTVADANEMANAAIESVGELLAGYIKTNSCTYISKKDADVFVFDLDEPSADGQDHTEETEAIDKAIDKATNSLSSMQYVDEHGNLDWGKAAFIIERSDRKAALVEKIEEDLVIAIMKIAQNKIQPYYEKSGEQYFDVENSPCFIRRRIEDGKFSIASGNACSEEHFDETHPFKEMINYFANWVFKNCLV